MIDRREILDIAGTLGLLPQVVEKDYVLGWVLVGIYQHALEKRMALVPSSLLRLLRHHGILTLRAWNRDLEAG